MERMLKLIIAWTPQAALRGALRLASENDNFAHLADKEGNAPGYWRAQPGGRDPVALLKSITGVEDNILFPLHS